MYLQRLSLRDFRNYAQADLELQAGVNVFVGRNGQGKTNLVEALLLLASGKSHRITTNTALIQKDANTGIVRATVVANERALTCEWELNRDNPDRLQLNGNTAKAADFARSLSVVMFAPEDVSIVRGEPGLRRTHIDDVASWVFPRLRGTLTDYERTLKQRNTLLKSLRTHGRAAQDTGTLDVWDDNVVRLGAEIFAARAATLELLQPYLTSRYRSIAGDDHHPHLAIASSVEIDENNPGNYRALFAAQLAENRGADVERGQTSLGPHRDDITLTLNDLPAKGYASHGETWSYVLALRLAELDVKRREGPTGDPIVILDDVFAELDATRRDMLSHSLQGVEQVLVTAAVRDDVPSSMSAHLTMISRGAIVADGEALP